MDHTKTLLIKQISYDVSWVTRLSFFSKHMPIHLCHFQKYANLTRRFNICCIYFHFSFFNCFFLGYPINKLISFKEQKLSMNELLWKFIILMNCYMRYLLTMHIDCSSFTCLKRNEWDANTHWSQPFISLKATI